MTERQVDHSQIRTNQAFTIGLLILAFVVDRPALVGFVGIVMLISAIVPPLGLFSRVYRHVLRPAGLVQPDVIVDNPEPHRFAQLVGGTLVTAGAGLLAAGLSGGWIAIGIVVALASLNLFAGWCAGCTMYYWFNRLGIPGFGRARIEATR